MTYCPNCMSEIEDNTAQCPHCGGKVNIQNQAHQLPTLSILHGRYLTGKVLGEGGFGITYIGRDLSLDSVVAVKEYYPMGLVGGRTGTASVTTTNDTAAQFEKGRLAFLDEAKRMHKFFGDPNIVSVVDVFYENNTAYMVMQYVDGMTMSEYVRRNGTFKSFDELYYKLRPVLESLSHVHEAGMVHRDISPSNLMIDKEGKIKLIDFGTARDMSESGEKSLSVVLKHGFAPPEQYTKHGKQGAWTDVYAMCATIYKLLTGVTPESAPDRGFASANMKAPSEFGVKITPAQELVIEDGMALQIDQRIPDMKELIRRFDKASPPKPKPKPQPKPKPEPKPTPKPNKLPIIIVAVLVLAIGAVFGIKYLDKGKNVVPEAIPINIGDTISFGTYEQDNNTSNGKEEIEWRVLAKEDDRILVISEMALDYKMYNTKDTDVTWETCSLRKWLNGTFLNDAFSAEEQAMIQSTKVSADKNPKYNTNPGITTTDKLFLLSITEAEKYFSSAEDRKCVPTKYAIAQGAYTNDNYTKGGAATCRWWLRSPGFSQGTAVSVDRGGSVYYYGEYVYSCIDCVRPALWINLNS